ncbi:MAG: nicotinate-nucleotide adenylyltransferase [Paraglaciecola sp.]
MNTLEPVQGLFGGTFDPIHNGHLKPLLEAAKQTSIKHIAVIPCHIPVHKKGPMSSSEHRLAMVELAIAPYPELTADPREIKRNQPSYSIDTLRELRVEYPRAPLCFFIGMDSLISLTTWHEWQALSDYCHLVVCGRPGYAAQLPPELLSTLHKRQITDPQILHQQLAGCIYVAQTTLLDISSTDLRQRLAKGQSTLSMLPAKVLAYIQQHKLYQPGANLW